MVGFNGQKNEPPAGKSLRMRSNVYAIAAAYLLYLYYKVAAPYLTQDPYDAPSTAVFLLATVILGGGGAVLGLLAWKLYRQSRELEQEAAEAGEAEDAGEDSGEEDFDEEDFDEDFDEDFVEEDLEEEDGKTEEPR